MKRIVKKTKDILFGTMPASTDAQITMFKKVVGTSCLECHETFNSRAWNSFVLHLIDDHKVDSETAYKIINELAALWRKRWAE